MRLNLFPWTPSKDGAPLAEPRSLLSGLACGPRHPPFGSRSSLHKPKFVVFPLRSVATRDDSMYGTDGHETRRLGAESRLDKPRDSLVRDGVTRRVREAAFFIFHRPPRFARVLPHLSGGPTVPLSHVDNRPGTRRHEEKRPTDSAEGNSDLGAQRDLDVRTDFRGERRPLSLEGEKKYLVGLHTTGNAILACTLT